ncbi:twin-arginine translocase TatA/TatE family subunit [Desulfurella sp.]|uniref:Sec-independent protein translocase subunit TatA/TatB n=1 Tax=Desulfurella sp. TaxID=1962857 RepID=UPI0025BB3344|nr:twin-arginine translocase TatA/TatE family subunit [Desulfurella sp.]
MFGISDSELLVILFILIVIVGPRRLPEIAREFAKFYRAFIKAYEQAKNDIKQNIDIDSEYIEDFKKIKDIKKFTNFKDVNPTEKLKSQWKDLLNEAKTQEPDKEKENNTNEERSK